MHRGTAYSNFDFVIMPVTEERRAASLAPLFFVSSFYPFAFVESLVAVKMPVACILVIQFMTSHSP
jgi:hypothetical protein